MSRESSDEELLKIIIAGKDKDNEAIKSIYNKYVGPIYKYIFFHIGDKSEVEDITSEVFIKVIKNIKKIRDTSNYKAWIYRVAKNTISDYWRKH
ncbi:MAG: sigma-70 family RNA polymerase sigma factor, partial [Actinomycetia bacterium]|nr:sigma-70 family RNA polymerase sigma factor [Actinomycetes bacterium]